MLNAAQIAPHVSWGTNPGQVASIDTPIPSPSDFDSETAQETVQRALDYMGLKPAKACATSASTLCSSVRAPTAGSKTSVPPPR